MEATGDNEAEVAGRRSGSVDRPELGCTQGPTVRHDADEDAQFASIVALIVQRDRELLDRLAR